MSNWIDIDEEVPEVGETVLGFRPTAKTYGDDVITILRYEGGNYLDLNGNCHGFERNHYVSHWMPLPKSPYDEPTT